MAGGGEPAIIPQADPQAPPTQQVDPTQPVDRSDAYGQPPTSMPHLKSAPPQGMPRQSMPQASNRPAYGLPHN